MPNFRVNKSCVDNFANISFRNILVNNINLSYDNSQNMKHSLDLISRISSNLCFQFFYTNLNIFKKNKCQQLEKLRFYNFIS